MSHAAGSTSSPRKRVAAVKRPTEAVKSPLLALPPEAATNQLICNVFDQAFNDTGVEYKDYETRLLSLIDRYPVYAMAYVEDLDGRKRILLARLLEKTHDK